MSLVFERVSFTHEGAASPLFSDISFHCPPGWTGLVGPNGSGKTTVLRLVTGELRPDEGWIRGAGRVACCGQRTDAPPVEFSSFLASLDPLACRIRGTFEIAAQWGGRWDSLSHGERKRAQIASALWAEPDVLLLDEPTNHIDADARAQLLAGLRLFRGTGLLVSHDRELLDALTLQCAFVDPPTIVVRPGPYSEGAAVLEGEEAAARRQRDLASAEVVRLRQEAARRRREADGADARRSKRRLARGDKDGRARIDAARVLGKDARPGQIARQMDGRVRQAEQRRDAMRLVKRYDLGFHLPGTRARRARLWCVPAGALALGNGVLEHPALEIGPGDRIALTGPNGTGKSTLVRHVIATLSIPGEKVVYLPQEISIEESRRVLRGFRDLSHARQGQVLTVVSALGSRPPRLLESQDASPGEIRKLLLALGVVAEPYLIVMDEPTNHLDLPAIECLEEALAGCEAALLLVSHDGRFLERLASTWWRIHRVAEEGSSSRLEVGPAPA